MNHHAIALSGHQLWALPSGALWWPSERLLAVADLHLGKSDRIARRGGAILPPYETRDTLARLDAMIAHFAPAKVLCLGDSFDDNYAAETLADDEALWLTRMQAGRHWIWVTGNHDPAPVPLAGTQLAEYRAINLIFRHIAQADASGEISGHYHPKASVTARGGSVTRACFLADDHRLILPAFGTYTGGLKSKAAVLANLMSENAIAILTGPHTVCAVPMARHPARETAR